jgi:lanthanide-dependent methanol dehydrogenase
MAVVGILIAEARRDRMRTLAMGLSLASLFFTGCQRGESAPPPPSTPGSDTGSTAVIANDAPDDGQWVRPAKDYSSSRFSRLDQINAGNVGSLRVAFTFSTGVNRGHEAAPLVVGDMMYIVTPFPNILYALDLTKPGAPTKWTYRPQPKAAAQGVACCDVVNRGAAYADGKIVFNTLDNQTPWMPSPDGRCGGPRSATSIAARPSRWRR